MYVIPLDSFHSPSKEKENKYDNSNQHVNKAPIIEGRGPPNVITCINKDKQMETTDKNIIKKQKNENLASEGDDVVYDELTFENGNGYYDDLVYVKPSEQNEDRAKNSIHGYNTACLTNPVNKYLRCKISVGLVLILVILSTSGYFIYRSLQSGENGHPSVKMNDTLNYTIFNLGKAMAEINKIDVCPDIKGFKLYGMSCEMLANESYCTPGSVVPDACYNSCARHHRGFTRVFPVCKRPKDFFGDKVFKIDCAEYMLLESGRPLLGREESYKSCASYQATLPSVTTRKEVKELTHSLLSGLGIRQFHIFLADDVKKGSKINLSQKAVTTAVGRGLDCLYLSHRNRHGVAGIGTSSCRFKTAHLLCVNYRNCSQERMPYSFQTFAKKDYIYN